MVTKVNPYDSGEDMAKLLNLLQTMSAKWVYDIRMIVKQAYDIRMIVKQVYDIRMIVKQAYDIRMIVKQVYGISWIHAINSLLFLDSADVL